MLSVEMIHEFCVDLVGSVNPEVIAGSMVFSGFLAVLQVALLGKRLIWGKTVQTVYETVKEKVAYVPNDTVAQLLKLLDKREDGWSVEVATLLGTHKAGLACGGIKFSRSDDRIVVYHNNTQVNLDSCDYWADQKALLNAFSARESKELTKNLYRQNQESREAAKHIVNTVDNLLNPKKESQVLDKLNPKKESQVLDKIINNAWVKHQ